MNPPGTDPSLIPQPPLTSGPEQAHPFDRIRTLLQAGRTATGNVVGAPDIPPTSVPEQEHPFERIRKLLQAGKTATGNEVSVSNIPESTKSPEAGSYKNGWGFFDEGEGLDPQEYTVTQNDDVFIDEVLLGIDHPELASDVDRKLPMNPERQKIAGEGVCRAIEAKWELPAGYLKDIRHARNFLQGAARGTQNYYSNRDAITYQSISMIPRNGKDLADHVEGSSDFLHFGKTTHRSNETAPDRLEEIMRVYVHTPPEFNGHVAAALITAVREQLGRSLYLKIHDDSTETDYKARIDNMIVYAQTHGEMAVVAQTLRRLAKEHPEQLDPKANPTDRARQTAIPGVSIAEEPVQDPNGIKESFNSSRDDIISAAKKDLYRRFLTSNPTLIDRYKLTDNDIKYSAAYKGEDILRKEYPKMDKAQQAKLHDRLKAVFREEVLKRSKAYHISTHNFAMNERP